MRSGASARSVRLLAFRGRVRTRVWRGRLVAGTHANGAAPPRGVASRAPGSCRIMNIPGAELPPEFSRLQKICKTLQNFANFAQKICFRNKITRKSMILHQNLEQIFWHTVWVYIILYIPKPCGNKVLRLTSVERKTL